MDYYVGWDVGGWNCDKNVASRDALCVLTGSWDSLSLASSPWRGNLRKALIADGNVMAAIGKEVGIDPAEEPSLIWAIDTPLGWPRAFRDLIRGNRNTAGVPEHAPDNPYLFRETERYVRQQGFRCPLSPVRDMIGSQSTKGMHFLQRCGFTCRSVGIWRAGVHTVIETYPTPVRTSSLLSARFEQLHDPLWHQDVKDSLWCALVAALFVLDPGRLRLPLQNIPSEEGWIWIPADCKALEDE